MSPRHRHLLPWLALATVYVVWGSTYLGIAVVVREMPPFGAAGLRFFAAGLAMAALAWWKDGAEVRLTRRAVLDYAFVGVLLLGIANALVMWSEKTIPSGIAALIVATTPLWLTLFDGLRKGGQAWTIRAWLGAFVGLFGVALIARPQGAMAAGHWGAIFALQVATLSWALGTLRAQAVPVRLPVLTATAIEMLAGGLFLFVESAVLREDWSQIFAASATAWGAMAYLLVFGSLVGFTAFAYAINELPASTVGTYAYVNPVVAVLLGWAILKEPLSPGIVTGGLVILLAVILTTRRVGRRPAPIRGDTEELNGSAARA
jgi:drug/metabolite transporter (DMT)-like permease